MPPKILRQFLPAYWQKYGHHKDKLILTSLVFLAGTQSGVNDVAKRYQAFAEAHPALSVECAISGWAGTGTGKITIRHGVGPGVKVDWKATIGSETIRFVTDGSMGIDMLPNQSTYDRLPTIDRPYPGGRLASLYGFPFPLVAGSTPFNSAPKGTTVTQKGTVTELAFTSHTMQGDKSVTGDFGPDGRLVRYDAAKGKPGEMKHEIVDFSNYRFGAEAQPSSFDTNPPVGYSAYAFDIPPDILPGTSPVPPVKLTGHATTTLAKLATQPHILVAFVDDFLPDGMVASLERLKAKAPVVAVGLNGVVIDLGSLPLFRTNEEGFNEAGVQSTPQFYLMGNGKVIQAWSGFRKSDAARFEADVLSYLSKH